MAAVLKSSLSLQSGSVLRKVIAQPREIVVLLLALGEAAEALLAVMEQQRRGAGDFAPSHSLKMIQACVSSLKCQHDRCSRASSNQTDMASVWSEDCRNSSKPKRNSCHIEHVIDIPCTHPNCQVTLCSHVLRQTGGTVGLQDCPCNVQPTTALVFNLSAMVTTMNQAVAFKWSCHQESSESRFSHTGINSHFISSIMWNGSAQPRKLQQGVCNEHVRMSKFALVQKRDKDWCSTS